jgi:L-amino acid N-acyltransferase YncA
MGKSLLAYVIKQAEESSLHYITAFVAKSNEIARQLARSTGWEEIGEVPKSPSSKTEIKKIFIVRPV